MTFASWYKGRWWIPAWDMSFVGLFNGWMLLERGWNDPLCAPSSRVYPFLFFFCWLSCNRHAECILSLCVFAFRLCVCVCACCGSIQSCFGHRHNMGLTIEGKIQDRKDALLALPLSVPILFLRHVTYQHAHTHRAHLLHPLPLPTLNEIWWKEPFT